MNNDEIFLNELYSMLSDWKRQKKEIKVIPNENWCQELIRESILENMTIAIDQLKLKCDAYKHLIETKEKAKE